MSVFHIEALHTQKGTLVLDEIGYSAGDGKVRDVVLCDFDVGPIDWYLRAALGRSAAPSVPVRRSGSERGRLAAIAAPSEILLRVQS